tara:strand:+ start:307 stop:471 length:165 start_codon:yes stop_codon:yes gene_type:complete
MIRKFRSMTVLEAVSTPKDSDIEKCNPKIDHQILDLPEKYKPIQKYIIFNTCIH